MAYSYRELVVWQKSISLVVEVYQLTESFPKTELYGLTSQIRRAAVSIPANIAEGSARGHRQEYCQFVKIAYASGAELETHLEIAKRLKFVSDVDIKHIEVLLDETMKMMNVLARRLSSTNR
jgi:four helix bundle protein